MKKLQNKVVVVTGGSKGIGLGCALAMGRHGAAVVLGARTSETGQLAEQQLRDEGISADFVATDVTDPAAIEKLIETAVEKHGQLDCLVNNAGWHPPAWSIEETTIDAFEDLLRLNLTSTFVGCKYAVKHLRRSRGSIINMSSEVGLIGQQDATAYVTTKAGQVGLTKALALDLAPAGVRVNAVCPAGVMTPLMEDWAGTQYDRQAALEMVDSWHPLGRMATAEEIGEVCAFLASAEASFMTGQAVCPDGGASLGYRR